MIKKITSDKLSFYRTNHDFEHYASFSSKEEFQKILDYSISNNIKLFILGNGSNTLFKKKTIKTLIAYNKLPEYIIEKEDRQLCVSSSTTIIKLLKKCLANNWDSFYYLASVPATIGGALAMNAGRGEQYKQTIFDYVNEITYYDNGVIKTIKGKESVKGYRSTIFTGVAPKLILEARFYFPLNHDGEDPIKARRLFSFQNQDYTSPSCGSVFKYSNSKIMSLLKGMRIGGSWYSDKTLNWICNESKKTVGILALIYIAKILHKIAMKKAEVELIIVE